MVNVGDDIPDESKENLVAYREHGLIGEASSESASVSKKKAAAKNKS